MIELTLSNGKIYKFAEDISMKALRELGNEPKKEDGNLIIMDYNKKKLAAFSVEPKLSVADLDDMISMDFMLLMKEVVIKYNAKMQHFLMNPKVETKKP